MLEAIVNILGGFFLEFICYFTSLTLVPAATLGKVDVERVGSRQKLVWRWLSFTTRSDQGKIILSAELGAVIGMIFWLFLLFLVFMLYRRFHGSA